MNTAFFIVRNSQKQGPYTKSELIEIGIAVHTLVWYEGLSNWTEARYIEELKDIFQFKPMYVEAGNSTSMYEEKVGNVLYHADKNYVTLFTPQGEIYFEYASFGERLIALLLDRLICLFASIIPIVGPWLYYALLHSSDEQATLGQRAMNIRCLSMEGNRIDFGQATGRFFMSIISSLIFFIGYFLFFGNDKKQTLHDSVAKTIVVKEIGRKLYNF
ncbi:RDD family protein [Myroides fluvii]|uniref:RDD family protein n=1 Tax=Myroides fluvii TaxID=2572594 RepID=UPI00131E3A9A|nr:RDD family protein [Myroides fluvii]